MTDQRTMIELLRAPTEGYAEAILVPLILAEQFKIKHSLINMMTLDQFFGLEKDNPHDYIRAARRWLEKEPSRSIHTWEDVVSKFINEFFPPSRTTNLYNEILNFQQRFDESFHEAWDRYKDLLRAFPHHSFTELHQLDTFYNALNPTDQDSLNAIAGGNLLERRTQDVLTIIKNKSKIAKLTHAVNQQTSAMTTAMTAMLKQFQATPHPSSVKAVKETCVTCSGAHPYYQCLAAGGNTFPEFRDNIQGYVLAVAVNYNEGILTSLSNQTNEIKNLMASLLQMNTGSTSGLGFLLTVANPKGEIKAITTCSGLVIDGPTIPTPPQSIYPEVDERVDETFMDPDLAEYTIKVPPPPKMLKALLSNKEKLKELANTPLNENCSAIILKKLPERLGDPRKFLIPCGFNELKCKALANLGASINLMPLSVWKKLGLPELISTRMTLELANCSICTPAGITRDVFVPVGKFTFPADFLIVAYETDPRVPFILGRPFLRTARALIDVYGEEMILRDEGSNVLSKKLLDPDCTKDLHPSIQDDPLKVEFLLYQDIDSSLKDSIDKNNLAKLADNFVDSVPEMFTDEHALNYSSPSIFDEYDDEFLEVESDAENVCDDPFDSKGKKIKESKLLIDELDLPCDFLPFSEYESSISQDFSRFNVLSSTNNEDKI
uniref:Reverse transcriptase domain-containing protein n=1 Tax=Tanacetum cinerariifolium TaxID=118510 RepID=A0A6L2MG79_TANCI|nr:reverse transcriptase domain-containing protein [Tanacetum cinerariifolium]